MAYHELEPFGPDSGFWQAGIIAATIANVYRDPKKRQRPFTPQDFMPSEPMTDEERSAALQAKFTGAMMAMGGRIGTVEERDERRRQRAARKAAMASGK